MVIKPIWKKCIVCNGSGKVKTPVPVKNPAEKPSVEEIDCVACAGSGHIRTDDLHRVLKLRNGDVLYDTSIATVDPNGADIGCFNHSDKTCGALCAAFNVKMDETGKIHYACCAGIPKHVIGILEID